MQHAALQHATLQRYVATQRAMMQRADSLRTDRKQLAKALGRTDAADREHAIQRGTVRYPA